jgi:hypothetical protein
VIEILKEADLGQLADELKDVLGGTNVRILYNSAASL